jgi:hypothetical protein
MEKRKLIRLSCLFEKAVASNAKLIEKQELNELYTEYINDGREANKNNTVTFSANSRRTAS